MFVSSLGINICQYSRMNRCRISSCYYSTIFATVDAADNWTWPKWAFQSQVLLEQGWGLTGLFAQGMLRKSSPTFNPDIVMQLRRVEEIGQVLSSAVAFRSHPVMGLTIKMTIKIRHHPIMSHNAMRDRLGGSAGQERSRLSYGVCWVAQASRELALSC